MVSRQRGAGYPAARTPESKEETMLGLRESKTKKTKDMLNDVISYADDLVHDERMRADLRSALDHGLAASQRLREDSGVVGLGERLESDKKLRKSIRAMLDDLDS